MKIHSAIDPSAPDARHRIWCCLRNADRPLQISEIARYCNLSSLEVNKRIKAFVAEGFVCAEGITYRPVWNGSWRKRNA